MSKLKINCQINYYLFFEKLNLKKMQTQKKIFKRAGTVSLVSQKKKTQGTGPASLLSFKKKTQGFKGTGTVSL